MIAHYKKFGKYPSKEWLSDKCKLTIDDIDIAQRKLIVNGRLKKTIAGKVKVEEKKQIENKIVFSKELFYFFICSLIAGICIYTSIYYSTIFLLSLLTGWVGVPLAVGMTLYSAIWPSLGGYFRKNKLLVSIPLGFIISTTGVIILLASMVCTIAGQYNRLQDNTITTNGELTLIVDTNIKEIEQAIDQLSQDKKMYSEILKTIDRTAGGGGYWLNTNNEINNVREKVSMLTEEKKKLREEKRKLIIDGGVLPQKKTFSLWLSAVLSISEQKISFTIKLFFALIVDLLSPLCLSLTIYFYGRIK